MLCWVATTARSFFPDRLSVNVGLQHPLLEWRASLGPPYSYIPIVGALS
jgi:hypothetical protein